MVDERERRRLLSGLVTTQMYTSSTSPTDTACKAGTEPKQLAVKNVESEPQVVARLSKDGVFWVAHRLRVADFHAPADEIVDEFVRLLDRTPPNTWLHFHCAAGDGRTTTFMAMTEIMRSARSKTLDAILAEQCKLSPDKTNLCAYCDAPQWKRDWARERYRFLMLFYTYCKENGPESETFSAWKKRNEGRVPAPPLCPQQPSCANACPKTTQAACDDC
jgi:hypothetical protein